MIGALGALRSLGEPASLPTLTYYIFDDDPAVSSEAADAGQSIFSKISPQLLPIIDERVRADYSWAYESDRWRKVATTVRQRFHPATAHTTVLGLLSFHGSGYVRQAAIDILDEQVTSGLEIPFLLLRLTDWVSAVRFSAQRAIERRLTPAHRGAYLTNLSLIATLKRRARGRESPGIAAVETLLLGDLKKLIDAALVSQDAAARRFGLSLVLQNLSPLDPDTQEFVLERVIASSDPRSRLEVARCLANPIAPAQLSEEFLPRLLTDRSVAVRRIALGWCATRKQGHYIETLRAALLDRSSIIRTLAQFHLPKNEPIDLRQFYREAVVERRVLPAALGGLGEVGHEDDAELLVPFAAVTEVRVRKAALASLARLALEAHLAIFIDALQSSSAGVSRQARIALDRYASSIGAVRLRTIFAETPHLHVRRHVIGLINRFPKWQKLPLLIGLLSAEDTTLADMAHDFVRSWLSTYNRTHELRPSREEIVALRRALDAYGPRLSRNIYAELLSLADLFEKPEA